MASLECLLCADTTIRENSSAMALIESITNGLDKSSVFNSSADLRDHLIEQHSKAVAHAFFYPCVSNSLHIWLMSCVEFTPTEEESTTTTTTTTTTTSDDQSPMTIDEAVSNHCTDSCEGTSSSTSDNGDETTQEFNLDEVLRNFFQPEILSEINENGADLMMKSSRKRPHASESSNNARRKRVSPWKETSHELELDTKLLLELAENNAASTSVTNGLVDSKAKNKVTCVVCHIDVCNTARQRHVFMVHVKQDDMYQCPKCDYTNSNSIWEAKKHCNSQHAKGTEPISNEDKYRSSIMLWNKRCFPEWKQKRPSWWNEGDDDVKIECDDSTELIRSRINMDLCDLAPPTPESIIRDEDKTSGPPPGAPDGLVVDDRTCQLCWEECRYPGRHIAQKHLKKHLYECPVCHTFGSYEGCTVLKHVLKVHPEVGLQQPINNLEAHAAEIRDLQARCFPNRPMKLVRNKESTRPRERHHCQKCGAQVAQSDRQRHVYHKHLKQERIFECPLCNFASNYDVHRVKWHLKWMHKDGTLEPISHENKYREEIDALNEECFPGWQHRRKPFWWLDTEKHEVKELEEGEGSVDEVSLDCPDGASSEDSGEKKELAEEVGDYVDVKREYIGQPMKKVSEWTCMLCLKEFKPTSNFLRHVAKDHLEMPLFMCPLCDEGAADAYEVKAHIVKEHDAAHLEPISNLECNPDLVQERFLECFPNRTLKPSIFEKKSETTAIDESKVTCQECFQEMKTEDRQIHVYRHHLKEPRLYECPLCDFSHHACSSDVRAHIKYTHRDNFDVMPKANLIQHSQAIAEWNERCFPGWINRKLPASAMEDFNRCRLCDEEVRQTSRHIAEAHLKIQLHVCPLCDYGAPESRLVKRHIRNHHDDEELEPIANVVSRRADFSALHDKCFPGRPKRLSNITISDEGRRTKCKKCSAAVSRKRRLAHILEKHLDKTGYGCSQCDFTHGWDETVVQQHIKNVHGKKKDSAKVLSLVSQFEADIRHMGTSCFPDWIIDDKQFE